jgi:hypothetical protein
VIGTWTVINQTQTAREGGESSRAALSWLELANKCGIDNDGVGGWVLASLFANMAPYPKTGWSWVIGAKIWVLTKKKLCMSPQMGKPLEQFFLPPLPMKAVFQQGEHF